MVDLHGWITQQIDRAATIAQAAGGKEWHWEHDYGNLCNDPTCPYGELATDDTVLMQVHGLDVTQPWQGAAHIAFNHPAAVLRRCAADRKILEEHAPTGGGWPGQYACEGCGYDGSYCPMPITEHTNDCPTLLALAEGYGLTAEERAALDRPEPERPEPPSPSYLTAMVRLLGTRPTSSVPPSLRGPNWRP